MQIEHIKTPLRFSQGRQKSRYHPYLYFIHSFNAASALVLHKCDCLTKLATFFRRDTPKGTSETASVRSLQPVTSLSETFTEPYFLAHRVLRGIFNLRHIIAQNRKRVKSNGSYFYPQSAHKFRKTCQQTTPRRHASLLAFVRRYAPSNAATRQPGLRPVRKICS